MLKSQIHGAAHCAALNECDSCESARSNLYVMIELKYLRERIVSLRVHNRDLPGVLEVANGRQIIQASSF